MAGTVVNHQVFNDPRTIKNYLDQAYNQSLQPGEEAILAQLRPELSEMEMLDIGVGVGRTTRFLSTAVKRYTGIDFAPNMVRECRTRFPGVDIRLGDARDLSAFPSASFDMVLFSYNGLDCLDAGDRHLALDEIRRVLRRGGHFVYSFHNLNFLPELYRMNWSWNPVGMLENVTSWVNMRRLNGRVEAGVPYFSVRDGSARFRAIYYYARPAHEVSEMSRLGFQSVRVFRAAEGIELTEPELWQSINDPWVYLLCTL